MKETFDAETENPPELQRTGWQAILDNFRRHVEAKRSSGSRHSNSAELIREDRDAR